MLQPKSNKKQKQLKTSLKFKVVEGREAREFMDEERRKLKDTTTKPTTSKRRLAKDQDEEERPVVATKTC